jgi:hypothetical protein
VGGAVDTQSSGRAVNNGNLRPFRPGQSGNPGGKKKGVAAMVRGQTHGGRDIIAFMVAVMQGRTYEYPDLPGGPHKGVAYVPSPDERLQAAQWLGDRAFGKAPTVVEATVEVDSTVTHVDVLEAHLAEEDVERLVVALLGDGGEGAP